MHINLLYYLLPLGRNSPIRSHYLPISQIELHLLLMRDNASRRPHLLLVLLGKQCLLDHINKPSLVLLLLGLLLMIFTILDFLQLLESGCYGVDLDLHGVCVLLIPEHEA